MNLDRSLPIQARNNITPLRNIISNLRDPL